MTKQNNDKNAQKLAKNKKLKIFTKIRENKNIKSLRKIKLKKFRRFHKKLYKKKKNHSFLSNVFIKNYIKRKKIILFFQNLFFQILHLLILMKAHMNIKMNY